ncbi:glycosyltransferase family 1 protein [Prochlorococcus marinus str. MU1402]|uniref:glycosyltransferase family 4 protein n=1 Tax=Prochlorococcus marinus TaxID=1219 RepID=UPI001AD9D52C|nr:glycosyltransferase family 4 protein [Prochlorococcus marinus]MBO8232347.1 glycosyltransferase family 4 protein [Prochlorococcus marinus XMU1402]MBW3057075.1 glycosyltransferase family 1 protein [Prochlorococcus marinus str. MU1402]
MIKKKIIINLTEDWFFVSHFLGRALEAKKAGYDVYISCNEEHSRKYIEENGIKFFSLPLDRRGINPIYEFYLLLKYLYIFNKIKPDIIHNVGPKPIIYGSIIAKLLKIKSVINAPIGMGFVFTSSSLKAKLLKNILLLLFKFTLNKHHGSNQNNRVIFENSDDMNFFINAKIVNINESILIRGAGVEIDEKLIKKKKENKIPTISLVARMLKDKGIYEFVEAAKILHYKKIKARFLLIGDIDKKNPTSLKQSKLEEWNDKKIIEWLGWVNDVNRILLETDILCLPSYREGLPKCLLEGAAIGLPLVTTNTVGCKEVVLEGVNGYLVPIKESKKLSLAIQKLIEDKELRIKMGKESLRIAKSEFSSEIINSQTLSIYDEL